MPQNTAIKKLMSGLAIFKICGGFLQYQTIELLFGTKLYFSRSLFVMFFSRVWTKTTDSSQLNPVFKGPIATGLDWHGTTKRTIAVALDSRDDIIQHYVRAVTCCVVTSSNTNKNQAACQRWEQGCWVTNYQMLIRFYGTAVAAEHSHLHNV